MKRKVLVSVVSLLFVVMGCGPSIIESKMVRVSPRYSCPSVRSGNLSILPVEAGENSFILSNYIDREFEKALKAKNFTGVIGPDVTFAAINKNDVWNDYLTAVKCLNEEVPIGDESRSRLKNALQSRFLLATSMSKINTYYRNGKFVNWVTLFFPVSDHYFIQTNFVSGIFDLDNGELLAKVQGGSQVIFRGKAREAAGAKQDSVFTDLANEFANRLVNGK